MADTIAQLADGTELHFPDGTKPEVVQKAVKTYLSKQKGTSSATSIPGAGLKSKDVIATLAKSLGTTPDQAKKLGSHPAYEAAKQQHEATQSRSIHKAAQNALLAAHTYQMHGAGMGDDPKRRKAEADAANNASARLQSLIPDRGTLLNQIQPGFDHALAQQQGKRGAVYDKAAGLLNSIPDLALLATGEGALEIPQIAGQSLVARGFQAQQLGGLAQEAGNSDLRKKDPGKYWTSLLLGAGLVTAPDLMKGASKAIESQKAKGVTPSKAETVSDTKPAEYTSTRIKPKPVIPKEAGRITAKPGMKPEQLKHIEEHNRQVDQRRATLPPKPAIKAPDVPQVKPKVDNPTVEAPKETPAVNLKSETVSDSPKPATAKPEPNPDATKAANAHVEAERMRHGLPPLPDPIRQTRNEAMENAFSRGMHHNALKVAEEVVANPRQMNTEEIAANLMKKHEVKNSMNTITKQVREAVKAGDDISGMKSQYDALRENLRTLTDATKRSGTQQSQAFSFRSHEIDDYSHANMTERMEMRAPEKPLTTEEKKAIDEASDRHDKKQAELEQHLESDPASVAAAEEALVKERKAAPRARRAQTREALDKEYDELKTRFVKKATGQLNSLADPALIPIIKDMARNRVHAGVLTVADVVDEVHSALTHALPDLTKRDVRDAWSGYGQGKNIPHTPNAELKEQARLMSKIEDVKNPLPKRPGRKASDAVIKLRQQYAAVKNNLSPEERNLQRKQAHVKTIEKKLAGKVEAQQKLTTVDTPEMQFAKKKLSDLQAELRARQKAAGPAPPVPEQLEQTRMQKQIRDLQERMEKGDIAQKTKPKLSTVDTEETQAFRKQLADEQDRLRIMQKTADLKRQTDRGSADTKVNTDKKVYDDKTKTLIAEMEAERRKFDAMVNKRVPPSMGQRAVSIINAGRLSSPAQVAKVMVSHAGSLGQDVMGEYIASGADRVIGKLSGNGRTMMGTSLSQMGDRMKIAATQGIRESMAILRHGEEGAPIQNLGQTSKHGMDLNYTVKSKIGQAYINSVSSMHAVGYRPFRLAAYVRSLQSEANLIAHKEGLKGTAFRARVKELIDNPTETMAAEASLAGDKAVATQDNAFSRYVANGNRSLTPAQQAMSKYVLPFTKVPGNLAVKSFRNLPVVGILPDVLGQIGERGKPGLSPEMQKRWAQTIGKQVTGSALAAFGMYGAKNGWMTGYGPRKDGKPPGSIKIAGRWFEVQKLVPVGNTVVLGASITESGKQTGEKRVGSMVGSVAKDLAENPVSMAAENVDELMSGNKTYDALAYQASGVIPRALSDLAATLDSKKRKTGGIVDDMKNDIPGLRNTLTPTGQPETRNLYDPFHSVKDSATRPPSSSRGSSVPKVKSDGTMATPRTSGGLRLPPVP